MADSIDNNQIARTAIELWHCDANSFLFVGNSANQVFRFVQSGQTHYLRLISSRHRTKVQIQAELDFITYLHRGGVNAMLAVPSAAERLIEEITIGDNVQYACVFEEARGQAFQYDAGNSIREHFRLCGKTLGRIHALSTAYFPADPVHRFAWDQDSLLVDIADYLPTGEEIVWRKYVELKERLQAYPKSNQTYGLIHGDFGVTNYRCLDGQLNLFDFDDCCYHWFSYDLAITIYPYGLRKEARQLFGWLLEGYSEHMQSRVTLGDLTTFCEWRLVYMFLVYARKWGFKDLSQRQTEWFVQKRDNITRGYNWES